MKPLMTHRFEKIQVVEEDEPMVRASLSHGTDRFAAHFGQPLSPSNGGTCRAAQPEQEFALPAPFTHADCTRYVGGWPWIHLFHFYLSM